MTQNPTLHASLALLLLLPCAGQDAPLQRFRTFYSLDHSSIPRKKQQNCVILPASDVKCVASANDGAVWLATPQGLIRYTKEHTRLDLFAGKRYLPDDDVVDLIPDKGRGMWVKTRTGVSHIELRHLPLAEKAEAFEQRIIARHDRYGLVADSILDRPGDLTSNRLTPNDNDGLWTAIYVGAECLRYEVTKSADAIARARKSLEAMLFLEEVTGGRGFPARSYIRKGDWRPQDGVWHWTKDGKYEWKADTSSDEIVGHYFAFGLAWDHLPANDPLRPKIEAVTRRITDHILDNRLYLIDVTGKPTRWGRWAPEYFASPTGKPDSPLNALELLFFLKTAHHITKDEKYDREYARVANDLGYLPLTAKVLELREELNYSDEELAMLPFYLLFRYEKRPAYRRVYEQALDQWWQNMQREKNPLWTFIYKTAKPNAEVDMQGAIETLYRIPNDLITWTVDNSQRRDIVVEPDIDRHGRKQSKTLLPPDERPISKWNANVFRLTGGNGGRSEDDGAFFLLPYWLGRYHRFVAE